MKFCGSNLPTGNAVESSSFRSHIPESLSANQVRMSNMPESISRTAAEHIPRRSPRCRSCGRGEVREFYRLNQIPAHTVLLLPTEHEAVNYPKRDLVLAFCECCGF